MKKNYSFQLVKNIDSLNDIKKEWINSLTAAQDGMWESFRNSAVNWSILYGNDIIGYAAIGDEKQLIQFYVSPKHLSEGEAIFTAFIHQMKIKTAIVGTNNLTFLSVALNFVKEINVNTYLFRSNYEVNISEKEGMLKVCKEKDLERTVHFCHYSMGAPKAWLNGYIGGLIERGELFSFEDQQTIIGTCEVRKSTTAPAYADIGMVISPDYRRRGYGTYLLHRAKKIALEWGKIPICSCEKTNIGSVKSIQHCGFISVHQLLAITF